VRVLFDTNVVSELAKVEPAPKVAAWVAGLDPADIHLSVITLGELRKGVDSLAEGKRRQALSRWLDLDIPAQFEGRILPIDARVADLWGSLLAKAKRPLPALDGLIAATALAHRLKLVTRNAKDFEYPGLSVVDPWGS
jgi:predicted nucleic acid-binding protein